MLAYMVKKLIEKGTVCDIKTRTELYREFIIYITKEHNKREYNSSLAWKIEKNLMEISYSALALKNPQIQKISFEYCITHLKNITCKELTFYGLVNLIVEKNDFLYFTHQSFQEYFAACYVKENPVYIKQVISQMWHPKWKEVINFLEGLLGTCFIQEIYSGKDNVIHSHLFLAIECIKEIKEKESEFILKLQKEIKKIPYQDPFKEEIIRSRRRCS